MKLFKILILLLISSIITTPAIAAGDMNKQKSYKDLLLRFTLKKM